MGSEIESQLHGQIALSCPADGREITLSLIDTRLAVVSIPQDANPQHQVLLTYFDIPYNNKSLVNRPFQCPTCPQVFGCTVELDTGCKDISDVQRVFRSARLTTATLIDDKRIEVQLS